MVFPNSELDRLTGYGTSEVSVELLPRATIIGVGLEGAKHSIGPWLAYVDQRSWRWTCGSARYSMCDRETSWTGWWIGTFFIFPYIGNVIIPTDELIFFRGGRAQPPTSHDS